MAQGVYPQGTDMGRLPPDPRPPALIAAIGVTAPRGWIAAGCGDPRGLLIEMSS